MKKTLSVLLLLTWILAACAPQPLPTEPPVPDGDSYPNDSYPNDSYPNEDSSGGRTPAQQAAITHLSQTLSLSADQITLISTEAVEWPDGCLGIQREGVMCTQAIVPGYRIILSANGVRYEVRTNESGSVVALVPNPAGAGELEEMLIRQLSANLGLKESEVSVVSLSEAEFSDACLDVAMKNVLCAQMVTLGKIAVLEANGRQYTYHVSANGSRVQPATLALTWSREGGIAGFCDSLTVFLSGEIYASQCKSQRDGTMGTFAATLSADERRQFETWIQELGEVTLDASDPKGVSDRMEVKLELHGLGSGSFTGADEQALLLWAQTVYQKLNR